MTCLTEGTPSKHGMTHFLRGFSGLLEYWSPANIHSPFTDRDLRQRQVQADWCRVFSTDVAVQCRCPTPVWLTPGSDQGHHTSAAHVHEGSELPTAPAHVCTEARREPGSLRSIPSEALATPFSSSSTPWLCCPIPHEPQAPQTNFPHNFPCLADSPPGMMNEARSCSDN